MENWNWLIEDFIRLFLNWSSVGKEKKWVANPNEWSAKWTNFKEVLEISSQTRNSLKVKILRLNIRLTKDNRLFELRDCHKHDSPRFFRSPFETSTDKKNGLSIWNERGKFSFPNWNFWNFGRIYQVSGSENLTVSEYTV